MQDKFKSPDVEEYILSHINVLQEIFGRFNYPNFSNFIKFIKTEFVWQSKLANYLAKNESITQPIIIDVTDHKQYYQE